MTPEQIHQLGLREVDRIGALMLVIARQQGFSDIASYDESLKKNPKFLPTSAEQILDDYRRYLAQMQGKLPQLFTFIPGSPVTVEAILLSSRRWRRIIKREHPMVQGPDGWSWPPPILRIAP